MAATLEQITADALALTLKEREQVADLLWASVDSGEEAPLSAEWEAELKRRQQAVADGAETFDTEEVLAELHTELRWQNAQT